MVCTMEQRIKYPRTRHAPWSLSVTDDDKMHKTMNHFQGREVVVTEKMDGENSTFSRDYFHARSVDSRHHPSRDAVKAFWGNIRYLIPEGWRVCGENLYAKHSIEYTDLPSYFMGFSVWDEHNEKLGYDEGNAFMQSLGIVPVKELWRGLYDEKAIQGLLKPNDFQQCEGYVLQITDRIAYEDFGKYVAKFVRPHHVQSDEHWMNQQMVPNKLKMK